MVAGTLLAVAVLAADAETTASLPLHGTNAAPCHEPGVLL